MAFRKSPNKITISDITEEQDDGKIASMINGLHGHTDRSSDRIIQQRINQIQNRLAREDAQRALNARH